MDYIAVAAAGLGGQPIGWLLSLDWHRLLQWYERASALSGKVVRVKWEA